MRDKRDVGGLMRRVPLCLINEIGIILYIVAALIIPEAPEEGTEREFFRIRPRCPIVVNS